MTEEIKQDIKKGATFGKWKLMEKLGYGGNSQVWKSKDSFGNIVAIKILTKNKPVALKRFKDEVKIMQACVVEGIIPIVDANLPDSPTNEYAWYTMPVGVPLLSFLKEKPPVEKVSHFVGLAEVLIQLHDQKITHRDIKPANIICLEDRACLADFGLVDYPDKEDLTPHKEDLGPRWTMAPEILRHTHNGETRPADVYSLAKSLWIVITGKFDGFDGRYDGSNSISIKPAFNHLHIAPLEELLKDATEHNPNLRPKMQEFRNRLVTWLTLNTDYAKTSALEWKHTQKVLFPLGAPMHADWNDPESIVSVLNVIGPRTNFNHIFFPTGGGLDLEKARMSLTEEGCIELVTDGLVNLLKPKSLKFEGFNKDSEWDYFRLECAPLEPTGVYEDAMKYGYEEVLDLGDGKYVNRHHWDNGDLHGEPLPSSSRIVSRFFEGAFVIFLKFSKYNFIPETYEPIHSKMDSVSYRKFISKLMQTFETLEG